MQNHVNLKNKKMEALLFILNQENILLEIFRNMREQDLPLTIPHRTLEVPSGQSHFFTFDEHPIFNDHNIGLFLLLSKHRKNHPSIQTWGLEDLCEAIAPEIDKLREGRWRAEQDQGVNIALLGASFASTEHKERELVLKRKFEKDQKRKFAGIQMLTAIKVEHEEKNY